MSTQISKTKWVSDPMHSEVTFKVKHLMITNVKGEFRQFSVGIMTPISKPPRQYALRLPYPQSEGALNPTNAQKYVSDVIFDRDPIFWDKVKVKWEF
jgi:hypothetical protein